jgi:His-Xaa-Ser system radical SAM maturase HxsC
MLPLHGTVSLSRDVPSEGPSYVLRLRSSASSLARASADFTIVRSRPELKEATHTVGSSVFIISDDGLENAPEAACCSRLISIPAKFDYLADGDILGFHPKSGKFKTLYRRGSRHNSFLVTDRCNHYCLMCSQPPKAIDDRWRLDEIKSALPLVAKDTSYLCFTGGEPLLDWAEFIELLAMGRDELPATRIHVLSNGRAFAQDAVVDGWAALRHPNLSVGIPIYSAVDHVHDYVVQARSAFDETVLGILKLKDRAQRVEIRVVLHALTAPSIDATCQWLARNLPFVDHVALMGLENTGFALANANELWIDPQDYSSQLAAGVHSLVAARVNVSIYNLQRCVLDPSVWPYAAKSISDWKNEFAPECELCIERSNCAGFFGTGRPRRSRGIRPIGMSVQ